MRDDKPNIIVDKTIEFSLLLMDLVELLEGTRRYVFAKQILKSGTSIGANVHEAQNAESNDDFIHKMKIAAKEADETKYWLLLCQQSKHYPDCKELQEKLIVIIKILSKIISSSKR